EKISGAVIHEVSEIKKHLQPGDILAAEPKPERMASLGFHHRVLRKFLVGLQGTPFTHVGMYIGNGKVLHSNERDVHVQRLNRFSKDYGFKVLRVDASPAERAEAVDYAKKQIGKEFNLRGMMRLALPVGETTEKRVRQENADKLFCSQLVANAYP